MDKVYQNKCFGCGASINKNEQKCSYCGTPNPGYSEIQNAINSVVGKITKPLLASGSTREETHELKKPYKNAKLANKYVYGILGILLGGIGAHKFYIGRFSTGLVYIIFCWTGIPEVIGLIEGILALLKESDDAGNAYF